MFKDLNLKRRELLVTLRERKLLNANKELRSVYEILERKQEIINRINQLIRENEVLTKPQEDEKRVLESLLNFIKWLLKSTI